MSTIHEVYVRRNDRYILGPLTRWSGGSIKLSFNENGYGSVSVDTDEPFIDALEDGGGILVVRDDGVNRTVLASASAISSSGNDDTVTFELEDDNTILDNIVALPVPSGPPYNDQEFDVRTGLASTIIWQYVYYNAGPGATPQRQWPGTGTPGLTLAADPTIGDVITGRARFQTLKQLLRELALVGGGLRFSCAQALGSQLVVFRIESPTDRSTAVRFSRDKQSIGEYSRSWEGGGPNYVYAAAGDAFGADRSIYEQGDTAAIAKYGRRETFYDTRGQTSGSETYQAIAEALALSGEQESLEIQPSEYVPFVYGRDYFLGDIVGVDLPRGSTAAVIREVTLEITPEGGLIAKPVIGTPWSSTDDYTSRHIAALERRLSNIERNYNIPDDSITPEMQVEWARWNIGDMRETLRTTPAPRWQFCEGQEVSRTTYAALFALVGTTFGAGNGTTTFNLPNRKKKYSRGAGDGIGVGASGGTESVDVSVPAHSHTHSHGGGGLVYTHSHPGGSHTHDHDHELDPHVHDFNIDHNHASVDSGPRVNDTPGGAFRFDEPNSSSGTEDHHHVVDLPNYSANKTTEEAEKSSGGTFLSTKSRTGVTPTSAYSTGTTDTASDSWAGVTDPDSTSAGGSTVSVDIEPSYFAVNYEIYVGV